LEGRLGQYKTSVIAEKKADTLSTPAGLKLKFIVLGEKCAFYI
jgi:hypothetical protein